MKRLFLLAGISAALATVALVVLFSWKRHTEAQIQERLFLAAESAFASGDWEEGLFAIDLGKARADDAEKDAWVDLELQAATQALRPDRLERLFRREPARVAASESAMLLLGRMPHLRTDANWQKEAAAWREKTTRPHLWFALDVDELVVRGEASSAKDRLKSTAFPGRQDVGRLTRLAVLEADESDLLPSWTHLTSAVARDPTIPEVRLFRAQILERAQRPKESRVEYVAAWSAAPESGYLCDQLASFYLRQGQVQPAIATWCDYLAIEEAPRFLWKAWAWNRLVTGNASLPELDLLPDENRSVSTRFLHACLALPPGSFWSSELDQMTATQELPPAIACEVAWLRIAHAAREGRDSDLLIALEKSPEFSLPVHRPLVLALNRIATFRTRGDFDQPRVASHYLQLDPLRTHRLVLSLEAATHEFQSSGFSSPPELDTYREIAGTPYAYVAAFLAAGWREAALLLLDDLPPSDLPPPAWLKYGLTQALRWNRDPHTALAYLVSTEINEPSLRLLEAELRLETGEVEAGRRHLETLLTSAGLEAAIANRSVWLLITSHLSAAEPDRALEILATHRESLPSVQAIELEARAQLLRERPQQATELYQRIQTHSLEARAYLARRSFAERDLDTAERLTRELIEALPDHLELHENLALIRRTRAAALSVTNHGTEALPVDPDA